MSDGAEDVICREYELRPQIITKLIESVAEITKDYGYVIIGVGNNGNRYNVNGIDTTIDIAYLVELAMQQLSLQIQAEYQVYSLKGKRICVIRVLRCFDVKKQFTNGMKMLHDSGKPISIIEALNLDGLVKAYLNEHIDKIYKYDTLGNTFNFLISYVKVKDFGAFWDKYVEHIETYNYPYKLIDIDKSIRDEYNYADIRYIKTIHNRNGKKTTLDHICLKIME